MRAPLLTYLLRFVFFFFFSRFLFLLLLPSRPSSWLRQHVHMHTHVRCAQREENRAHSLHQNIWLVGWPAISDTKILEMAVTPGSSSSAIIINSSLFQPLGINTFWPVKKVETFSLLVTRQHRTDTHSQTADWILFKKCVLSSIAGAVGGKCHNSGHDDDPTAPALLLLSAADSN